MLWPTVLVSCIKGKCGLLELLKRLKEKLGKIHWKMLFFRLKMRRENNGRYSFLYALSERNLKRSLKYCFRNWFSSRHFDTTFILTEEPSWNERYICYLKLCARNCSFWIAFSFIVIVYDYFTIMKTFIYHALVYFSVI